MPKSVTIGHEALYNTRRSSTRRSRAAAAANARHSKDKIISISQPAPASDTLPGKGVYFFAPEHYARIFGKNMPATGNFEIPVIAACLRIDGMPVSAGGRYITGSFGTIAINNLFVTVDALRSLDMSASRLVIEDARINEAGAVMLRVSRIKGE